jgi:hypothetical protein
MWTTGVQGTCSRHFLSTINSFFMSFTFKKIIKKKKQASPEKRTITILFLCGLTCNSKTTPPLVRVECELEFFGVNLRVMNQRFMLQKHFPGSVKYLNADMQSFECDVSWIVKYQTNVFSRLQLQTGVKLWRQYAFKLPCSILITTFKSWWWTATASWCSTAPQCHTSWWSASEWRGSTWLERICVWNNLYCSGIEFHLSWQQKHPIKMFIKIYLQLLTIPQNQLLDEYIHCIWSFAEGLWSTNLRYHETKPWKLWNKWVPLTTRLHHTYR